MEKFVKFLRVGRSGAGLRKPWGGTIFGGGAIFGDQGRVSKVELS